uniref:Uncharacterized protein n=1 Tax=viral metagenome TaxID=1070528 RepID=A0A6C0I515_9ZZZZ
MSQYFDEKELFREPKTQQFGSHMVMTNVQKQGKTKWINIDTKYRDDYQASQTCNFNITLPERINEVKTMSVQTIEIPMSFYNISANLGNNCFIIKNYSNPSSSVVINIADGYYTTDTIATAINDAISGAGGIFTSLVYRVIGSFSTFYTADANNTFIIEFDVDTAGSQDRFLTTTKLGWILGFRGLTHNVVTTNPSYGRSEKFIDLTNPRFLYLAIEEFNKGNQKSFIAPLSNSLINKNIIARITMTQKSYPFGTVLIANMSNGLLQSDVRTYSSGKVDLQKMNIQLVNEIGIPMDLNGLDFSFCLKVEHEA